METLVLILMLLVCFNFALKQTFLKTWQAIFIIIVLAIIVGLSWEFAIEQSKSQIAIWLADQSLMLNTSVIITIETIWQISYCMLSAHLMHEAIVSKKTLFAYRILRFFPGILIVPVLFSALVAIEYEFTGSNFALISWSFALGIAIIFPLISYGISWLLPQKQLRLEVLFLTNVLIMILGIIATVNGTTNFHGSDEINWMALITFGITLLICATIGFLIQQRKSIKQ